MKWRDLPAFVALAAISISACETQKQTAKAPASIQTATIAAHPTSSTTESPSPSPLSCDVIMAENRKIFSEALVRRPQLENEEQISDGGVAQLDDYLPAPCLIGKNGAWSLALDSFESYGLPMFSATWSLVHISADKKITRYTEDGSPFTAEAGGGSVRPEHFWTYDFDDDGEPELIFAVDNEPVETSATSILFAFRFANGGITSYVPVTGFTDLRDVDGDGRFDALVDHETEDYGGCGVYEGETLTAPSIVAHGIHGGFSTSDEFAKHTAHVACPSKPTAIVVSKKGFIDESRTADNVVCARVWGMSAAEVTRQIEASCQPFGCKTFASRPALAGECFHMRTLIDWAKEPPAVTLP